LILVIVYRDFACEIVCYTVQMIPICIAEGPQRNNNASSSAGADFLAALTHPYPTTFFFIIMRVSFKTLIVIVVVGYIIVTAIWIRLFFVKSHAGARKLFGTTANGLNAAAAAATPASAAQAQGAAMGKPAAAAPK
jgi:hypothetical protein